MLLHGTRSAYDPGQAGRQWGYGAGGSVTYYAKQHLRYWLGVESDRDPRDGSFVTKIAAYDLGLEFGPRRPRRIEPYSRVGVGIYNVHREYWGFVGGIGQIESASDTHNRIGLCFGAGGRARAAGPLLGEVGLSMHLINAPVQTDAPNINIASMLNVTAGLGYTFH